MYDEDDEKDDILKMLGGEVDDFAGSQLKDPNEKPSQGVTIEISFKPHGEGVPGPEEETSPDADDPIAHSLGMCGGGCAMCKGGMA